MPPLLAAKQNYQISEEIEFLHVRGGTNGERDWGRFLFRYEKMMNTFESSFINLKNWTDILRRQISYSQNMALIGYSMGSI